MKILFFVGKGGVGKSTNSSLCASSLARAGRRVVLASIDPAHNLRDVFGVRLGEKPKRLAPNLEVAEMDLSAWVKRYLKETAKEFKSLYSYQETFNLHHYFDVLRYSPGLEEYAVLLALADATERYADRDYLVFDTPPTALTLKFLALPDVSLLWLQELDRFRSMILEKKEVIARIKGKREEEEKIRDPILKRLQLLEQRYEKLSTRLKDPAQCQIVLVTNPDSLSRAESLDIVRELKALGLGVRMVVLNKYRGQEDYLQSVQKDFPEVETVVLADQGREITGLDSLAELDALYSDFAAG